MQANANGPKPAYNASNGYVRYVPDANSDMFAYSQSSYGDYGAAPKGPYCDPATGQLVVDATGKPLPSDTVVLCRSADATLLGAVGGPKWDSTTASVRPSHP